MLPCCSWNELTGSLPPSWLDKTAWLGRRSAILLQGNSLQAQLPQAPFTIVVRPGNEGMCGGWGATHAADGSREPLMLNWPSAVATCPLGEFER